MIVVPTAVELGQIALPKVTSSSADARLDSKEIQKSNALQVPF